MRSKRDKLAGSLSELCTPPLLPPYKKTKSSKSTRFSFTEPTSRRDARHAVEQPMEDSDQDLPDLPSDLFTAPPLPQKSAKIMSRGGEEDAPDSGSDLSSMPPSPLQSAGEKDQCLNPRTQKKDNPNKDVHMGKYQRILKPFGNWTDQEKEDLLSARRSKFSFSKCGFQLNRHRIDCKQQYSFLLEKIRKGGYHRNKENKKAWVWWLRTKRSLGWD